MIVIEFIDKVTELSWTEAHQRHIVYIKGGYGVLICPDGQIMDHGDDEIGFKLSIMFTKNMELNKQYSKYWKIVR